MRWKEFSVLFRFLQLASEPWLTALMILGIVSDLRWLYGTSIRSVTLKLYSNTSSAPFLCWQSPLERPDSHMYSILVLGGVGGRGRQGLGRPRICQGRTWDCWLSSYEEDSALLGGDHTLRTLTLLPALLCGQAQFYWSFWPVKYLYCIIHILVNKSVQWA